MDDPRFIFAINKSGHKQRIPKHWLTHPVLSAGFRLPPSLEAENRTAGTPDEEWKVAELKAYADEHGVDRTGLTAKADLLAAIEAGTQSPSTTPVDDKTPATGDDEGAQ